MRPSKALLGVPSLFSLFLASAFTRAKSFARGVASHTFGEKLKSAPKPEEAAALLIEKLLRLHAPSDSGLWGAGRRHYLRFKRREFFKLLDRFKGVPSRNGHADGRPALMNRPTRRALAGRLQYA